MERQKFSNFLHFLTARPNEFIPAAITALLTFLLQLLWWEGSVSAALGVAAFTFLLTAFIALAIRAKESGLLR